MSGYHDTHPVHHMQNGAALKREGDTILIYPARDGTSVPRLTLSEWASAVAFTAVEGETGPVYRAILALLGTAPQSGADT